MRFYYKVCERVHSICLCAIFHSTKSKVSSIMNWLKSFNTRETCLFLLLRIFLLYRSSLWMRSILIYLLVWCHCYQSLHLLERNQLQCVLIGKTRTRGQCCHMWFKRMEWNETESLKLKKIPFFSIKATHFFFCALGLHCALMFAHWCV